MDSSNLSYENEYERSFYYIVDDTLRKHMWDALEFTSNILAISDKYTNKEKQYFYKTAIVYISSIVESQIHFCMIKRKYTTITNNKSREYKNINIMYEDKGNGTKIMSWDRERPIIDLEKWNVDFATLNDFAFTTKLYGKRLFKRIDKMRKLRNKIHLMRLDDIDRKYTKAMLEYNFDTAWKLFSVVEKAMNKRYFSYET